MRIFLPIIVLLCLCSACRFESAVSAQPLLIGDSLSGIWESEEHPGGAEKDRVIMRDMRDGRFRMLVEQGENGIVFDAHAVQVGKHRILQARLMGRLAGKGSPSRPGNDSDSTAGRWMIWVIEQQGVRLTIRALRPFSEPIDNSIDFDNAVAKALAQPDSLEPPRHWLRIGSDLPPRLKRSRL